MFALSTDAPPSEARRTAGTPEHEAHRLRSGVIWVLALGLLLLSIGLAVPDLRSVLSRASDASAGWLLLGVGLELASCLGYVAVVRLVLHRGPAREVRRLAWAEQAFGAVVGAGGAGSLAVGVWALRAWRVPWSRIANRSAVIFLLTSAVNCVVLGLAGIGVWLGIGTDRSGLLYGLLPAGVALGALAAFLLFPFVEAPGDGSTRFRRLRHTVHGLGTWVRDTEEVVFEPNWRLLGAPAYLLCDIAVLWACLRAVGIHPPLLALVVGYQIGYLSNVIPVPGGLGVLEGGLLAGLLLFNFPVTQTAAAVIVYHAIALWIPTIGGTIGFAGLRRAIARRPAALATVPDEAQSASGAAEQSRAQPREDSVAA
jgi:uncharacterized membrane protein YbhN (UPF0104 family)